MENEIVLFETEDHEVKLHVPVENNTVWLNRKQLAELFGRDVKTIGKHINNALKEELDNSVVANFATTAVNLSMVYAYYEIGRMIVEEEKERLERRKKELEELISGEKEILLKKNIPVEQMMEFLGYEKLTEEMLEKYVEGIYVYDDGKVEVEWKKI